MVEFLNSSSIIKIVIYILLETKPHILIAGIGGASLGTEIQKCLLQSNRYVLYGCDISRFAFGHYQKGFKDTFVINRTQYIKEIKEIVEKYKIHVIIPGGEEPLKILTSERERFHKNGTIIAANSIDVVKLCSDKLNLFNNLNKSIPIPKSFSSDIELNLEIIPYPCIIKPALESGGSKFVFLVSNRQELSRYIKFFTENDQKMLIQEYIPLHEGEFTVGVLSSTKGSIIGSIAMKRIFDSKLSVSFKSKHGLISSGYSQGIIDEFKDVRIQAENIAKKINSKGPLNIQGRMLEGIFYPFEINPRFSASTYLRSLAGFNEIDVYLRHLLFNENFTINSFKKGYYLRSFTEEFVKIGDIKNGEMD
ncbi:MAG: ATP-grasp domain-containing protein [Crenarchaeota archaeon]|nr:MAG: ATP-grasp domain-containing protein [Thermoproteota archaeon]RDJ36155.1 MAG: ATP-grasp domain-containing protein [Thermoproteota archaeon]RDJ38787.1 MAG: ATP-grasp domain-containing protein [Thermoproteota archaeon]